jgi:lipopolysaccharide transport system permease protein
MTETVIRPPRRFAAIDVKELWRYRALFGNLLTRRIKTQFENQALPWVWVLARPLIMLLVFAVFRHLSKAQTGVAIPYEIYLYSGLILWFFFTDTVSDTAASIRQEAPLLNKVYFPPVLSPLAAIGAGAVRLFITALPLVALMVIYGVYPDTKILLLPIVLLQVWLLIFGLGCMFTSLSMASGDWERFLTFALYVGLFLSPVIYAPALLPETARAVYNFNPLVGSLMAFRSTLAADMPWPTFEFALSCGVSLVVAVVGLAMFQWTEKYFIEKA